MGISSAAQIDTESSSASNGVKKPHEVLCATLKPAYRRVELHNVLNDLSSTPLIILNAWSGSGKTTFLADYAEHCTSLCLWYRVKRGDDLASLLYGLIVSAVDSHLIQNRHELYWALDEVDADNMVTVRRFFAALYKKIDAPLFIVIDDAQEVQFQDKFHDALRVACLELARGSRIVLANSGPCSLNLPSMRKFFPVAVLEDEDFSLSVKEVREIAKLYGRPITSSDDANRLWEKVGGCASCLITMLSTDRP